MKKKFIAIIVTAATAVALAVGLTACDNKSNTNTASNGFINSNMSVEDSVAFSMASTAAVAEEVAANIGSGGQRAMRGELTEAEQKEIIEQLKVLDKFIGEDAMAVVTEKSDREDYTHKMTVNVTDLADNKQTYVMYFNQTSNGVITESDWDEIEQTEQFAIKGVIVIGEGENVAEYPVEGRRTVETETEGRETETEVELVMTAFLNQDGSDKIVFRQESGSSSDGENENEFQYTVYTSGVAVKTISLEFENEGNEHSVEMKSVENGKVFQVEYEEKVINGKKLIEAEIFERDGSGNIVKKEVRILPDGDGYVFKWDY